MTPATFFLTVDRERLLSVFCRIPNVARNINLLAPFKASFRMPPSSEFLFEIKSRQNVLIVRAGLSVPSQEMSAKQINDDAISISSGQLPTQSWLPSKCFPSILKAL